VLAGDREARANEGRADLGDELLARVVRRAERRQLQAVEARAVPGPVGELVRERREEAAGCLENFKGGICT
jgi:hypothetical protein